jgi:hypothetical protein
MGPVVCHYRTLFLLQSLRLPGGLMSQTSTQMARSSCEADLSSANEIRCLPPERTVADGWFVADQPLFIPYLKFSTSMRFTISGSCCPYRIEREVPLGPGETESTQPGSPMSSMLVVFPEAKLRN